MAKMFYGERLQHAMDARGAVIGRKITRLEVSRVADCSRQNIGMIITNAKGVDQKLSSESHAAVAAYLKVSPDWLLNEVGEMLQPGPSAPSHLSPSAIEIGVLFDMIPASDAVRRIQAFNAATTAIMQVLQASQPKSQPTPLMGTPAV